ncbi:MAG: NAD(P)/FAD-dependent oxidoreductase [Leptospira sp.]|nr:NAD(P)/FAD-dependent oxidoreductase [Leptospira sp.]
MNNTNSEFDVIIIGGSFAGLSSALSLGRSLRKVLVVDSGKPCNRNVSHSHNFLTHDGVAPAEIRKLALKNLEEYNTVQVIDNEAIHCMGENNHFKVELSSGNVVTGKKLLFATGVKDIMPNIEGFAECWGRSIFHCPYCHGYEIRESNLGIMANGDFGFDFARHINNWSKNLKIFTNGKATFNSEQLQKLTKNNIKLAEKEIGKINHKNSKLQSIVFLDGTECKLDGLFAKLQFEQHCKIPIEMGCEIDDLGYIKIDGFNRSTIPGVYSAGDNTTMFRSLAYAISEGNKAGAMVNRELIEESF